MLNSLYIKNYRILKELKIASVSQINLITGKNNTGKSSLLEAIALLACEGDFDYILSLLDKHGYLNYKSPTLKRSEMAIQAFSSLFSDRKPEFFINKGIKICDGDDNFVNLYLFRYKGYNVTGQYDRTPLLEEEKDWHEFSEVGLMLRGANFNSSIVKEDFERTFSNKEYDFDFATDKFQFIESGNISRDINSKLFDNIALKEPENLVVDALRIIDPAVNRIGFRDEGGERKAVIKLSTFDDVIPLSDFGDGINRILTIILAMVNCENGFLLIDEFENGLHYSVQENLWKVIFKLAKDLNVQVFATTHSNDCINSFTEVLASKKEYNRTGKLIRLENIEETIKPVEYSSEELESATKFNLETR